LRVREPDGRNVSFRDEAETVIKHASDQTSLRGAVSLQEVSAHCGRMIGHPTMVNKPSASVHDHILPLCTQCSRIERQWPEKNEPFVYRIFNKTYANKAGFVRQLSA